MLNNNSFLALFVFLLSFATLMFLVPLSYLVKYRLWALGMINPCDFAGIFCF
jgi:hypothetical protein